MRKSHNTASLFDFLARAGIQPTAFAFFVVRFIKAKRDPKLTQFGVMLIKQLEAQAELIEYHLRKRS